MSKVSLDLQVEQELIAAIQAGDKDAFGTLYEHYHPHIRRFFAVKLTSADTISDLTSQVFEKALKGIDKFSWQGYSFSAWLYRIAHNALIDYYRKQSNQMLSMPEHLEVSDTAPEAHLVMQQEWENKMLQKLLKDLPEPEKQIIYMKFFDGYTNKVIAEKLEISETNVGTIVYRTVQKLRKEFTV